MATSELSTIIMPAATESARTAERIAFGVNAERPMSIDNLALDAVALATVTGAAYDTPSR